MPATSIQTQKRPRKLWWLVGMLLFAVCVLVQMPAAWIVEKYAPDTPYLQHVSGNLWQGSAIWQLPEAQNLSGAVEWTWQPWQLLLGRIGAKINVTSGQSNLAGQLTVASGSWALDDVSGKISQETLASVVNWQLPEAPIQVNALSLQHEDESGFTHADGQLTWVGGELGYPSGGNVFEMVLPAMRANVSSEQKDGQNSLHINLLDNQDKRLGDLYLDAENMLDVNLTQRLLEQMPEYQGQAPQDTVVVSVRQPLSSGLEVQ